MRMFFAVAGAAVCLVAGASGASAQNVTDSYCTQISDNDKFASDGFKLTDAASIIRQDRANYHKFKMRDQHDEGDRTFRTAEARSRIPGLLDNGGTDPSVFRAIVRSNPYICVDVYRNSMEVFLESSSSTSGQSQPDEYPFVGTWDCEVATFSFTPDVYNNGSEDLPISEIQEGTDGSYTLFLPDDYVITLSGFDGETMGWYSHASGDAFTCTRTE